MARKLIASYFGKDQNWERMAKVLRFTAETHCPNWEIKIDRIDPASYKSILNRQSYVDNTQKMEHWCQSVQQSSDGDELLLIDADTAIINPLDSIWDKEFDLAYTVKASRFPFNSGVVFLRVNPNSRAFIDTWFAENMRLLKTRDDHRYWRQQFGGINQASLGSTLTRHAHGEINLLGIPCEEWNCEDASWKYFSPETTKILHIKGRLRGSIFESTPRSDPDMRKLYMFWKDLEIQASGASPLSLDSQPIEAETRKNNGKEKVSSRTRRPAVRIRSGPHPSNRGH